MSRLTPSPISVLCGSLLFGLLLAFGAVAALVVPPLVELLPTSPRLAMLGFLAFALSPGAAIMLAHHLSGDALARAERLVASRRRALLPDVESWAAGAFGWLVLYGTSLLTNLVMLVFDPPQIDPERLSLLGIASSLSVAHVMSLHSAVWIFIATCFYELSRRAKA